MGEKETPKVSLIIGRARERQQEKLLDGLAGLNRQIHTKTSSDKRGLLTPTENNLRNRLFPR